MSAEVVLSGPTNEFGDREILVQVPGLRPITYGSIEALLAEADYHPDLDGGVGAGSYRSMELRVQIGGRPGLLRSHRKDYARFVESNSWMTSDSNGQRLSLTYCNHVDGDDGRALLGGSMDFECSDCGQRTAGHPWLTQTVFSTGTLRLQDLMSSYLRALEYVATRDHHLHDWHNVDGADWKACVEALRQESKSILAAIASTEDASDAYEQGGEWLEQVASHIEHLLPTGWTFGGHEHDPAEIGIWAAPIEVTIMVSLPRGVDLVAYEAEMSNIVDALGRLGANLANGDIAIEIGDQS